MRIITLSAMVFAIGLFLIGCNTDQTQQIPSEQAYRNDAGRPIENEGDEYWAKDNLDLERVGNLLERSESPEQFESYLNRPDGINNLDLNGDGYADYISVEEYNDRDSNSRGLSLFSRFGPNLIQEIAKVILYRDSGSNYPGARFLVNGNEQLYGDNNYYEANWLDRAVPIASMLFGNHDRYRSPYYYDNYPSNYQPYDIVNTPIYRTRIQQLYPQPMFVYTDAPTFVDKVKIVSPYEGKWMENVHAKLAKPNEKQEEFIKGNPGFTRVGKDGKGGRGRNFDMNAGDDKPGRVDPPRSERGDERGNPAKGDRGAERGNPDRPMQGSKPEHKNGGGSPKADNPNPGQKQGGGNPNKAGGGGNPNKGGGKGKKG
ncbi:MAG: hypothetical protein ABIO91_09030 [Pyrinomonadaceae bacterium]